MQLSRSFFNRDAARVAQDLLGKVIRRCYRGHWLAARIIETEAYYLHEKGSHASLGYTEKRRAMFMRPGTIYMYYARGRDSLNVSCRGKGNAVLIKSAYAIEDNLTDARSIQIMQQLNPAASGGPRPVEKLCSGQTLLCRALDIRVGDWDQRDFDGQQFYFDDVGYRPRDSKQARRLGIPVGRDEHLPLRFIDAAHIRHCTRKP